MDPSENPDHGASDFRQVQAGGDTNPNSHYQPVTAAEVAKASTPLPGEQPDPRFC
jgi:hypothetical protein